MQKYTNFLAAEMAAINGRPQATELKFIGRVLTPATLILCENAAVSYGRQLTGDFLDWYFKSSYFYDKEKNAFKSFTPDPHYKSYTELYSLFIGERFKNS